MNYQSVLYRTNNGFLSLYIVTNCQPLGGVFGLCPDGADFPSVAFNIEKLHINVSSTDISAPELSNSPQ